MTGRDAVIPGGHSHGPGAAMPGTKPGSDHAVDDHANHPTEGLYIRIAIILSIVTAVEVVIYYIEGIRPILVPVLIVLSLAKFVAVVGYFMHLKMDDPRLRWIFIAGLTISASVVLALLAMFWTDHYFWEPNPLVTEGIEAPAD